MTTHTGLKIEAWISSLISLLAAVVEVIRAVQQITRANDRFHVKAAGYLEEWDNAYGDCSYFVQGTDAGLHPGSTFWPPAFRLSTALLLLIVALSEVPGTKSIVERTRRLAPIFGPRCGVGPVGALQMLLALSILASPIVYPNGPQVLGLDDSIVRQLRLITAFMLLAIGGVNILLGILRKKQIRILRGQAAEPDKPKPPSDAEKARQAALAWLGLKAVISTAYASVAIGPLQQRMAEMEAAVNALV